MIARSWPVAPEVPIGLLRDEPSERSRRATNAMLRTKKLDIAALQRAYDRRRPAHHLPEVRVRPFATLVLAAALSGAPALAPLGAQDQAAGDTLATVTLPPELDRVLRDYERAWRARDAAALAELFTEDGFVLSGGRPPVRGHAAVRRHYTGQGGALHLRAVAWAAADTVGYIIGTYGSSAAEINSGKFVLALRRERGGAWRIAADMDNPNRPMRPPGGSGGATPTP